MKRMVTRGDQGQRPTLTEPRKRVPHHHPLVDMNGKAFTHTGRSASGERRMWLAGISAQRGY